MSDDLVKPCPFCGSSNLKSGGDDKIVGYWCLECEASGPNHYGRYEWNSRVNRIEELEAELAKAVEAMQFWKDAVESDVDKAIALMDATLAELAKERSDEKGETE